MRIDVNCSKWLDFNDEKDLPQISAQLKESPYIILGGGSNVLFTGDYHGTVLHSSILDVDVTVKEDSIYIKADIKEAFLSLRIVLLHLNE